MDSTYSRLNSLTYDQLIDTFFSCYKRDYGERKFHKIHQKIMLSNKVSGMLSTSKYHNTIIKSKDYMACLSGIPYFLFSRSITHSLGALIALERWREEINSNLKLLDQNDLKKIAIDILQELRIDPIFFMDSILDLEEGVELASSPAANKIYETLEKNLVIPNEYSEICNDVFDDTFIFQNRVYEKEDFIKLLEDEKIRYKEELNYRKNPVVSYEKNIIVEKSIMVNCKIDVEFNIETLVVIQSIFPRFEDDSRYIRLLFNLLKMNSEFKQREGSLQKDAYLNEYVLIKRLDSSLKIYFDKERVGFEGELDSASLTVVAEL